MQNVVQHLYDLIICCTTRVILRGVLGADYELVVFSGDEVRTFALPKVGAVTIGRGEGSGVRIDDPSVSRNHAILHVGPRLAIQDLGSANGTMVRDRAAKGSAAETLNVRQLVGRQADLAVGDSILFGTACVVVRHKPALELPDLTTENPGVIVQDPAMRLIYAQAARAARSPINILVLGETGVGKEVLAKAIHAHSPRAQGPFLGVNCAAMSESLQESELFGHEKGAFTGAHQARAGLFEAAAGGTVFLDEIGELAAGTQAKLLRVLEERVVTRLGSNRPRSIDVRIVAATNRDVDADCEAGRFRQDLFFRLNGISLLIPPLRDRPREIEPFARVFLAAACREIERTEMPRLSTATLEILHRYLWPGNVRELRSAIDRAVVLCIGEVILPEHLPPSLLRQVEGRFKPTVAAAGPMSDELIVPAQKESSSANLQSEINVLEKARIMDALERCAGNQTSVARMLGISRGTLIARLNAFGVPRPRKRDA
jgi:two-component system, NtrC family, response regulator AtoC